MTRFQPVVIEGEGFKVTISVEAVSVAKGIRLVSRFRRWVPLAVARIFGVKVEEAQPCNCSGS